MKKLLFVAIMTLGTLSFAKGKSLGGCAEFDSIPAGASCTCQTTNGPRDVTCGRNACSPTCENIYPGHTAKEAAK